ncbi:MAG: cobalamin-dependent protein [Gammaproteobacteria bacterium]|nr:cobalamin-dependent protein [Gammaproteobacteria bacterium]
MARAQPSPGNPFAGDLLERSAAGYAGFAASLMLERDPGLRERQGPNALAGWRSHLTQRVLELAAAVHAGDSRLFLGRVTWDRKAFRARGQDDQDIRHSIQALHDVLVERLPRPALEPPVNYVDLALKQLASPAPPPDASELDPKRPADRLALGYLQKVLEGNVADAIELVTTTAVRELGTRAAYTEVLLPAQREVGRLWHSGELSIAEEHMVTSATQRTMSVLVSQATRQPANGRTVVVAAISGNVHDVGLRALADMYQLAGWRVVFVGADVPMQDLPTMLAFFEADLLMLGATLGTHVPRVEQAIRSIRERCERPVRVVVGGAAFDAAPDLWSRIGSDGYAPTIDQALELGARLVGLPRA